jgi:hypothetical protein
MVSYASDRRTLVFKDRNGRNISQMPLTTPSHKDETNARRGGPRVRVVVSLPGWLERLIEKLVRRWIGARRG